MNEELERKLFERTFGATLVHELTQAQAEALWRGWKARALLDHKVAQAKSHGTASFAAHYFDRYLGARV